MTNYDEILRELHKMYYHYKYVQDATGVWRVIKLPPPKIRRKRKSRYKQMGVGK